MKSEQPELWSPPPSSSASTPSFSDEEADAEDRSPYDSDELQYPSSDSDLKTDVSNNSAETSSQDPPSPPQRPPHTLPLHRRADSGSSTTPDTDFCIVERVDEKEESLDEQVVPSSAAQHIDQEFISATATVPDIKATWPQEVQRRPSANPIQEVAGEQGASPSLLLPSLLDYDAVLTTTATTTSATQEATRLEHLQSIQTSRKLNLSPTIIRRTSKPTETETSLSRNKKKGRFAAAQESQVFMLAVLGAIGVSGLLILAMAWVIRSDRSSASVSVQPPSHAFLRYVDYNPDGVMGIVHMDLYTSKGTPFLSQRVHPFHARVDLGDPVKRWTPPSPPPPDQATPVEEKWLGSKEAASRIILDLGNGTYQLHIHRPLRKHSYRQQKHQTQQKHHKQHRNQYQDRERALRYKSWLCPEVSPYYLHLWFENGTRVPDTPYRLEWSTTVPPLYGKEEVDEQQEAMGLWTNGLQPVLCELHRISDAVMSLTFQMSKMILSFISHSIDRLLGIEMVSRAWSLFGHTNSRVFHHHQDASSSPSSASVSDIKEKEAEPPTGLMVLLDQRVKSLTRAVVRVQVFAGIQLPTPEKVLETADRILVVVEEQVVKVIQSKRVRRISKHLRAHEILHRADRVFFRTEQELERLLKTDFVQNVNRRVKRQVEELQATPQGERWSHRLKALREGVDRRWTRFQTSLLQDD
ncbi:hypothetical protein BGZ75_006724 [Mortierella antarctica]|nr:hypothetical protein BGZ75_006724 [Mortierella antarctica]